MQVEWKAAMLSKMTIKSSTLQRGLTRLSSSRLPVVFGVLYALGVPLVAANEVGKSVFVRGVATSQSESGEGRILGKDSPLSEGDVITTGSKSFAILGLIDGTRLTLKPNTVFKVEGMKFNVSGLAEDSPEDSRIVQPESLRMRLFRGGLRAITGLIAKRNDKGVQIATPVATIGVQGTDFEARLCEDDCQAEAERVQRVAAAPSSPVVARVAFLTGTLTATGFDGRKRQMSLGGSLLAGDTLQTGAGSVTVIVFRDESRVTIRENSRFQIDSHEYQADTPEENSTLMRLLEGSIRVVSGLIAKTKPKAHKVVTPVATMSVRGTGFDIDCGLEPGEQPADRDKDGCDVWVWEGAIVLQIDSRTFVIPQGRAYFVGRSADPIPYRVVPPRLQNQESPEPDPSVIDQIAFGMVAQEQPEVGLYIEVTSGDVIVTNRSGESRVAGHGETLFVNVQGGQVQQVSRPPRLIGIPDPALFDDSVTQEIMLLNPAADVPQRRFECVIG